MGKNKGSKVPKQLGKTSIIPRQESSAKKIPTEKAPILKSDGFSFVSPYPNWIKGTDSFYKRYDFTNMVKDAEEFSKNMTEIVTEIIPKLYLEYKNLFVTGSKNYHCHPVSPGKMELVKIIAEEIHNTTFNLEDLKDGRFQWWYLGFKNSVRLVGLYNFNKHEFYPMFIDHHHLLHDNPHYNQNDFKCYSFCPVYNFSHKTE